MLALMSSCSKDLLVTNSASFSAFVLSTPYAIISVSIALSLDRYSDTALDTLKEAILQVKKLKLPNKLKFTDNFFVCFTGGASLKIAA